MTQTAAENPKAVIYCRVSSVRQLKDGDGLASQETRCREYARHRGYEVAQVFRDEGVSGGMIDRPGMIEMLAYLRTASRRSACVVLIDDISRLARGLEAHLQLRTAIAAVGGKLESPSIEFGEDSDSVLVENLLASVSQHQRQKNAEQTKNRMRSRFMGGYWVFHAPFGYRYARVEGHGKMLVPNEPDASIMREALEGYASGRLASQVEVKRYFDQFPKFANQTAEGIRLARVREMLERPVYAGYIDAPNWGVGLLKAKHQALISFETHQRVLERLNGPIAAATRKDTRPDFPLRGIVTCACCGRAMTGAFSKGRSALYGYYFCQTKGCEQSRKSIRVERIEGEFEAVLKAIRPDEPLVRAFFDIAAEIWDSGQKGQAEQQSLLKAELAQIERKSGQLMERLIAAESGALIAAYEEEVRKLQERRIVLQEKLGAKPAQAIDFRLGYRTALSFVANPGKLWGSDDLTMRRIVPKLLFGGQLPYHCKEGYRTADIAYPFRALQAMKTGKYDMVPRRGLEPPRLVSAAT